MINYTSDCCGAIIEHTDICSQCCDHCTPLPTSELINELIRDNIDSLKFNRDNPFLIQIWIDIKGLFLFEADAIVEKYNWNIYEAEFKNINFLYKECEDNLILFIENETKYEIIEKLNVC